MERYTNWLIAGFVIAFFIGCSQVRFDRNEDAFRCQNFTQDCVAANGVDSFDYTITIGKGLVDILFVDDNSGSMSTEQRGMAAAFNNFLSTISNLDWRIGITTTDVSGRGQPLTDGLLIDFTSGLRILSADVPNGSYLFQNTIQRQETLICENSGFSNCPSGDERGIFAATLAVKRNQDGFMRPNAHLAVVILSDEDVRSTGFASPTRGYEPTSDDRAESFVGLFQGPNAIYPDKTMQVHSIIVRPGDSNCKAIQDAQGTSVNAPGPIRGQYGYEYARLSQMTSGVIGNICDGQSLSSPYQTPNYTAQVGQIGSMIQQKIQTVKIACRPIDDQVLVTFNPQTSITASLDAENHTIAFSQQLPSNTKVRLQYRCTSL